MQTQEPWHKMTHSRRLNRLLAVSDVKLRTWILRLLSKAANSGHLKFKPVLSDTSVSDIKHSIMCSLQELKVYLHNVLHLKGRKSEKVEALLSDTVSFKSSQQASLFNLILTPNSATPPHWYLHQLVLLPNSAWQEIVLPLSISKFLLFISHLFSDLLVASNSQYV